MGLQIQCMQPYFRALALLPLVEMKVKVKILQGAECNVDVTHGDSVETLKVKWKK